MKIPNTINSNTIIAYINQNGTEEEISCSLSEKLTKVTNIKRINAVDFEWINFKCPATLRDMCLKQISFDWHERPRFNELENIEDKNTLLDLIDVRIPLKILTQYIGDDVFWRRCFQYHWPNYYPPSRSRPWLNLFIEKYLTNKVEFLKPINFDEEDFKMLLEICSPYVNILEIKQLQPSLSEPNYHIPMVLILSNLRELRAIDLSYDLKSNGGMNEYFLGCTSVSRQDAESLSNGLEKCIDLIEFRIHNSKLEPYMLDLIAKALNKSCNSLETIKIENCGIGDDGLKSFLTCLSAESFPKLHHIDFSNNFLSNASTTQMGVFIENRDLSYFSFRFNPIFSDGATSILMALEGTPLKSLDLSCCSLDHTVQPNILDYLRQSKHLKILNISTNTFSKDFGKNILEYLNDIENIEELDLRNCGLNIQDKIKIDAKLLMNSEKQETEKNNNLAEVK